MHNLHRLFYLILFMCFPLKAEIKYDKQEEVSGVMLTTRKIGATRHYKGVHKRTFMHPLEIVKNGITNFSEKCNNDYKSKRNLTDKEHHCIYHIDDVVELKVVKILGENSFLLANHLYLRGTYTHHDQVTLESGKNEQGQATLTIYFNMLTDEEVAQHIQTEFRKDSNFTRRTQKYVLTAISGMKTEVSYEYHAETEHWLLNKQLSVPQVFATISSGVNEIFRSVELAASTVNREVASKK